MEVESQLGDLRVSRQLDWGARFPGLVQGITLRAPDLDFGSSPRGGWATLQSSAGIPRVACCRQVHGAAVAVYDDSHSSGVKVLGDADAIVTAREGVLLAVTVADCVPVFVVEPVRRLLGLAHAGWRGTAAGIAEATLGAMSRLGAEVASLHVHLGAAICRKCYKVGPEVTAALGVPEGTRHVDLRDHIARSVRALGVDSGRLTASQRCTRCDSGSFYSYRGGDRGQRMCAFLGWSAG
ncbi:MAG: polyphenol oxidase family protein [Gemmatimonadota bacterium]|nr:MAG: polyphenol oxidase family protein [Gemmatimonadota bacterium]